VTSVTPAPQTRGGPGRTDHPRSALVRRVASNTSVRSSPGLHVHFTPATRSIVITGPDVLFSPVVIRSRMIER
jgi:hypothetical protein